MKMEEKNKVWFITGVSSGFGKAFARVVAQAGHTVIGTLRKEKQIPEFDQLVPGKTFGKLLDVTHYDKVPKVIREAVNQYGRIDVLVNNAGYGLVGAIEELTMEESRGQMETNFFGALAVTQAVLPHMRARKSGHIFQISSVGGFTSFPSVGIYNASKYALEGFSESLWKEVSPFNMYVTIVEPGAFRTEWAGGSMKHAQRRMPEYSDTAGSFRNMLNDMNGTQEGDPVLAGKAILQCAEVSNPPLRLPLGEDSITAIREKLQQVTNELNEWEEVIVNTRFGDEAKTLQSA